MPAVTDADGHVAQVTEEGALLVSGAGVASTEMVLKRPGTTEKYEAANESTTQARLNEIRNAIKSGADVGTVLSKLQELIDAHNNKATEATLQTRASEATVATLATQATLEAVRTILDGIDNDYFRRTDPLAAGNNLIGFTGNPIVLDLENARLFATGAQVSTSLTSPNASLTIENPATSGKAFYVVSWAVYADARAPIRYIRDATSSGTLLTIENLNGQYHGVVPSAAVARAGSGVLTGGRVMAINHAVNTQAPVEKQALYKLMPGQTLTIRFIGPGAANVVDIAAQWTEKTI